MIYWVVWSRQDTERSLNFRPSGFLAQKFFVFIGLYSGGRGPVFPGMILPGRTTASNSFWVLGIALPMKLSDKKLTEIKLSDLALLGIPSPCVMINPMSKKSTLSVELLTNKKMTLKSLTADVLGRITSFWGPLSVSHLFEFCFVMMCYYFFRKMSCKVIWRRRTNIRTHEVVLLLLFKWAGEAKGLLRMCRGASEEMAAYARRVEETTSTSPGHWFLQLQRLAKLFNKGVYPTWREGSLFHLGSHY